MIETAAVNAKIMEAISSDDHNLLKKAELAFTDVTRTQLREKCFTFEIMAAQQVGINDLDRDLTAVNRMIFDLEVDSPGSKWVALQGIPDGEYIQDSRYQVLFSMLMTPKFNKTIQELYSVKQDIRKMLTENAIKDGLAAIDGKFIETVRTITGDTLAADAGNVSRRQVVTKKVQYMDFTAGSGDTGLTRANLVDALAMLPRGNAKGKFRLKNNLMLMNDVTAQQIMKWDRNTYGDDTPGTFVREGLTHDKLFGLKWISTIKDDIIADGEVFFFAAPDFLGRCLYIDDWTTFLKKEGPFIETYSYWYGGISIGNLAGVGYAKFSI